MGHPQNTTEAHRPPKLHPHNPPIHRNHHRLCTIANVQLAKNIIPMKPDSTLNNIQSIANIAIIHPLCHQTKYFQLAIAQILTTHPLC